jgi:diguanylate cyclase (GGDEF)-like protein
LASLLSVSEDRLDGMDRAEFAAAAQSAGADSGFRQMLARLPDEPFVRHDEIRFSSGGDRIYHWSSKPVALPDGDGQLDVWKDITAERELERAALTDPLTTLANRRGGEEAIKREVARCKRIGQTLSFLMIDIDHFKKVNDTRGHEAGDRVLRGVARITARQLRASDLAIRWGGEEFLCLLPGADIAEAHRIAERIRVAIAATTFETGDITVSIGCAQLDARADAAEALAKADAKLYEAKGAGRNRVR